MPAGALVFPRSYSTTLGSLHLFHNEVGDDGAQTLAEKLESNTVLTDLDLGSNGITDDGCEPIARVRQLVTSYGMV